MVILQFLDLKINNPRFVATSTDSSFEVNIRQLALPNDHYTRHVHPEQGPWALLLGGPL